MKQEAVKIMEEKIVQQDDHIILPRATLKRFMDDKTKRICYLDLKDINNITIKQGYPKSYHTIADFYNPKYDEEVKKRETAIGELYKDISTAINNNTDINIDEKELKQKIIDFMTIEFHRSVIANDSYLEKYRDQQQKRNDIVDCIMLQTGNMTDERSEYSLYYREQAKSKEAFRYYSQNILATDNQAISAQYYGFFPYILYIPKDRSYQFMLPPIHFVGNDKFAAFILSPSVALALFPAQKTDSLMAVIDEEGVKSINMMGLECVSAVDSDYREFVGGKEQLEKLKEQIERIKAVSKISENGIVIDGSETLCLQDLDDVVIFVIILFLIFKAPESLLKVRMGEQHFEKDFFKKHQKEIRKLFRRHFFELIM